MKNFTTGVVQEITNEGKYIVQVEDGQEVICSLSTKSKVFLEYDILLGEEVQIEVSPIDKSMGRIEPRGWDRKSTPPV